MLNSKQLQRLLSKLVKFERTLEPLVFNKICELKVKAFQTEKQFHEIPDESLFRTISKGHIWSGEGNYFWVRTKVDVPEHLDGRSLFLRPELGFYEGMLWVDGKPFGIYASKESVNSHGNHYCNMIRKHADKNETIDIAVEFYAGHYIMGTQPMEKKDRPNYEYTFNSFSLCVKNDTIADFLFDLKVFNQMAKALGENSFTRAEIIKHLVKVHEMVYYSPEDASEEKFIEALKEAGKELKKCYSYKNANPAPFAGIIGHSHMDTAWLWHIGETVKKCARTYSNQISLMEQYPEYMFIQSSAYHGKLMKKHYPQLFEDIKKAVKTGKYEPNGAVWVECDCNIVSGESLVRQFLWGQRFTREEFCYTSNAFWLPDTFGYSAAIPQIMKSCGVDYFLTTKMAWNDTNKFPYETFYWQGIDGTKVLTHLNRIHVWPDPKTSIDTITGGNNSNNGLNEKIVSNMRLLSYGYGDGGGGPQFEMVEMAKRCADIQGCPKMQHISVGDFMKKLESGLNDPSTYNGELYLELHRGTLTNQHTIKRNNRLCENAIRNLEVLTVMDSVEQDIVCSDEHIRPHLENLLVNQFHDILPGTCIPRVHDESIKQTTEILDKCDNLIHGIIKREMRDNSLSIVNTLPFERRDVIYLDYKEGYIVEGGYSQQVVNDIYDAKKIAVDGLSLKAFSCTPVTMLRGKPSAKSKFTLSGNNLITPFALVTFNDKGYIESYIDRSNNRELRGEGYALNTFLIGEEFSSEWDSWDIDADYYLKIRDDAELLERNVISNGPVELRIRSKYKLTDKSFIKQDMIFYGSVPEVRFETEIDWNDNHRLLKAEFDTSIVTDFARQEIQFGHIRRLTSKNSDIEKARFEVCNHKYTDISENRYGVSLINDCKYGISVEQGKLGLTLHKGGCRPDYRGDKGVHYCSYSFLPHNCGYSAESVIQPAYEFNVKPLILNGYKEADSFIQTDKSNIIIETIKPCEDNTNAYILRLYDAEGTYTNATLKLGKDAKKVDMTNMLEEVIEPVEQTNDILLSFKPFEIKTLKVTY